MISGSGNNRRRHGRIRDGRHGRHAWTDREPDTWAEHGPITWTDGEPNTWADRERTAWSGNYQVGYDQWDDPATWTERPQRKRALRARVIVPVAIPTAMGLALGMVLALSGKPGVTQLNQSALGVQASQKATGQQTATQNTTTNQNTTTDTATTNPTMSCTLIVPQRTLSARGLATPYELTGPDGESPASSGCAQSNPNLRVFVQATIVNPRTGALYVYEPLVVTLGTDPAAAPVLPKLPRGSVVDIMIGFTGSSLRLAGAGRDTLADQKCVDGANGSLFGQVAYCNSVAFFAAADQAIADGKLKVPARGKSPVTKQACPTARGFALADQNPGVGVPSQYLLTATGQTAQDNAANRAALRGSRKGKAIAESGDSRLLDGYVLPTLGCRPFTAPDLSERGAPNTSEALDELSAASNQRPPSALVPENAPMTMVSGAFSVFKTNLYRLGIGQPFVSEGLTAPFDQSRDGGQQADTPANYCANMLDIQTRFLVANAVRFQSVASPVPAVGDSLLTYLASRLSASYANLRCGNYGLNNTVRLTLGKDGVATGVSFSLAVQQPSGKGTQPAPPHSIPLPTVPATPSSPSPGSPAWWIGTP